jgi:hypothetical protein
MGATVCIGAEFTVDDESRLTLANLPEAGYPYVAVGQTVAACMQASNGLRVDPQSGPWIPQVGAVPVAQVQRANDITTLTPSTDATGVYEFALAPWYLTNLSAYQQMCFVGWVEWGVSLYTQSSTWIEHWGNVQYPATPGAQTAGSAWGPIGGESPSTGIVWHHSAYQPVQMVVDIADQQPVTVRAGARSVQGAASPLARMRDWWVGLYGVTYLLDPGPVG